MLDRGELHAMDDDEKVDQGKDGTENEVIGEEQVEKHQKARAMVSLDISS